MLKPHVLLNEHKSNDNNTIFPPLMESLVSTDECLSFQIGNPICFTPFEVGKGKFDNVIMRTHSRVEIAADNSNVKYDGFLVDPDLRAELCTQKSFKRLLKVLGFKWDYPLGEGNTGLDTRLFVCLMMKLSQYPLGTNEEIKLFMESFCLNRLIELDETLTPAQNRDRLSEVLCALQPCRLAVYNGQHREAALKAGLSDLWFPSGIVHRDEREYMKEFRVVAGTFPYKCIDPGARDFQCFKTLRVSFGSVRGTNNLRDAIKKFRKYGTVQAAAQNTTVKTNHASILNEYMTNLPDRLPGYVHPNFENFWEASYQDFKKQFGDGIAMIAKDFVEFLGEYSYENQCGYDHRMTFQKEPIIKEMTKLDGTTTVITTTTDRKTGVSGQVLYMTMLLKLAAISPAATKELTRFLSGVTPSVKNRPMSTETKATMGTFDFMKHSLYIPFLHVIETVNQTAADEMFWLKAIENEINDKKKKDLHPILSEEGIVDISSWNVFQNDLKPANHQDLERLTRFSTSTGLKRKIWSSLSTEIIEDFFKTLVHFGMDPLLTKHFFMTPKDFLEHDKANLHPNDSLRMCLM